MDQELDRLQPTDTPASLAASLITHDAKDFFKVTATGKEMERDDQVQCEQTQMASATEYDGLFWSTYLYPDSFTSFNTILRQMQTTICLFN